MIDGNPEMPGRTWDDIWQRRQVDPRQGSTLARLMRADGFDAFGELSEASWRSFVDRVATGLGIEAGNEVFEVGCGAGAFLYPLYERGCRVGGLDLSDALVETARAVMPEGRFRRGDAMSMDPGLACDAAVSCGVFLYFPNLDYARRVLERMARSSRGAVAVLDVPDRATEAAALAQRRAALGEAEYAARYRGLDHLYYDRAWFEDALAGLGFRSVVIEPQSLEGYAHAPYRFNVIARRDGTPSLEG